MWSRAPPCDLREPFGPIEELRDLVRELGRVFGIGDEEPGLAFADKLHQSSPARRQHRRAGGHGFDRHHTERFLELGGHHGEIGGLVILMHMRGVHGAGMIAVVAERLTGGEQPAAVFAAPVVTGAQLADQQQKHVLTVFQQFTEGEHQIERAFLRRHAPGVEDDFSVRRQLQARAQRGDFRCWEWPEGLGVHAVGDEMDVYTR